VFGLGRVRGRIRGRERERERKRSKGLEGEVGVIYFK